MNRSNFLAMIPSLAMVPLIGKNIVKTDGGIFIEKPVPIDTKPVVWNGHIMDIEIKLFAGGIEVGQAYMTELEVHNPMYELSCADNMGARQMVPGHQEITFKAVVTNLNLLL